MMSKTDFKDKNLQIVEVKCQIPKHIKLTSYFYFEKQRFIKGKQK